MFPVSHQICRAKEFETCTARMMFLCICWCFVTSASPNPTTFDKWNSMETIDKTITHKDAHVCIKNGNLLLKTLLPSASNQKLHSVAMNQNYLKIAAVLFSPCHFECRFAANFHPSFNCIDTKLAATKLPPPDRKWNSRSVIIYTSLPIKFMFRLSAFIQMRIILSRHCDLDSKLKNKNKTTLRITE